MGEEDIETSETEEGFSGDGGISDEEEGLPGDDECDFSDEGFSDDEGGGTSLH